MNKRTKIFLFLTVSAVVTGLSVAFSKYFGLLEWISLVPLILALNLICNNEKIKLRRVYLFGLFYFEIFYAVCFHWFISLYPLDFTGLNNFYSVLVIIVAWFGLPLFQALLGGLVFVLYAAISKTTIAKKHSLINALSIVTLYTFYEFTQTLGWWGVPWGRLSLGQADNSFFIMGASLFGSYFITAVIMSVNALLAFAIINFRKSAKAEHIYALSALLVFLVNLFLGIGLYYAEENRISNAEKVTVGVIQGNFSSTEKWSVDIDNIFNKQIELTEASASNGAEVIIWAETSLPFVLRENGYHCRKLSKTASELGVTILVGALEGTAELDRNAIICYAPDGSRSDNIYAKRHLVPFGEYVPMRGLIEACLPFLTEISILNDDWMPGEDSAVFDTDAGKIGSLICFDSIYETLARESVIDGAQLLAVSTNDSWFSDSAAIYMHNNQARMRAVENGRFVARSANTGLSSFITSHGNIISFIPPLEEGYLNSEISILSHKTLFTTIGNAFVYTLGFLSAVPLVLELFSKIKTFNICKNANNSSHKGE